MLVSYADPICKGLIPRSDLTSQGGGGGTLIFSHIRRLGLFFGVQNSEFPIFLWVFRKMNFFGGYEDFMDIFWGHHKIGLV